MEEKADVMTDYQLRTIMSMIITIAERILDDNPETKEFLNKLKSIRDGKTDEPKN